MNEHRRLVRPIALACAVLLLTACCQHSPKRPARKADGFPTDAAEAAEDCRTIPKDRPYYKATPQIQQDIHDLMSRVPAARPDEFNILARKIAVYGEPAVPVLVGTLREQREERVHIMAAYVLGMLKDPRSLSALHEATFHPSESVRFEAATSMLRMHDRRGLTTMIAGLEHPDPLVRARSILVLEERTGETFGYKADARPGDRAAAVSRWRAWHVQTSGMRQG